APPAVPPPAALEVPALTGDWARAAAAQGVEGIRLADDGKLTVIGTAATKGVGWKMEGNTLVLSVASEGGSRDVSVPVEEASVSRLRLGGANPAFAGAWRRATFTTIEGTVTYRQRSALTPEAVVYADPPD